MRRRLALALGITAFVSVLVTALVSLGLLRTAAEREARDDLRRIARAIASADVGDERAVFRLRPILAVNGDEIVVVRSSPFDGETTVGLGTPAGRAVARAVDLSGLAEGREVEGTVSIGPESFAYVAAPTRSIRPGAPLAGILLARPVRLARDLFGPAVARIALAGIVAAALAFGLSVFLARRLAKPVRELSAAADRIAHGDLAQRVPVEGDDELGNLARSFNDMSVALTESQRREREFLASVSHELRTPITAIRGYTEGLQEGVVTDDQRDEALQIIRNETVRLERMVSDVMDLARLGARRFALDVRDVEIAEVLREAVSVHRPQADAAAVGLTSDLPDVLRLETDPDRVRQVVSNLVENALRVTPASGVVSVRARPEGNGVAIEVADTGPGIAPDDLPHVFERSYLWRASRGERPVGTGLGLAIVRELAATLGGQVEVRSEVGRGSTFRVMLPGHGP